MVGAQNLETKMTTPNLSNMRRLQAATRAARARTGDPRVSVGVRAGLYQVQLVSLRPGRAADVVPVTNWGTLDCAIEALEAM